jgi:hypothetical protein
MTITKLVAGRCQLVAKLLRDLLEGSRDAYQPELHYMRGPGPRWREKYKAASPHSGNTPPAKISEYVHPVSPDRPVRTRPACP